MAAALLLREDVHLGLELGVRRNRARLREHHSPLDHLFLDTAQEQANIVAGLSFVEQLTKHLDAGHDRLLVRIEADELHFLADLDPATLDTTRRHRAAARDREHVFDRKQERLVGLADRLRDERVERGIQLVDLLHPLLVALQRA